MKFLNIRKLIIIIIFIMALLLGITFIYLDKKDNSKIEPGISYTEVNTESNTTESEVTTDNFTLSAFVTNLDDLVENLKTLLPADEPDLESKISKASEFKEKIKDVTEILDTSFLSNNINEFSELNDDDSVLVTNYEFKRAFVASEYYPEGDNLQSVSHHLSIQKGTSMYQENHSMKFYYALDEELSFSKRDEELLKVLFPTDLVENIRLAILEMNDYLVENDSYKAITVYSENNTTIQVTGYSNTSGTLHNSITVSIFEMKQLDYPSENYDWLNVLH